MKKVFKCGIPLFYLILLACINIIESENVVLSVKGIKDLRKKKEMKKMLKARLANNCISGTPEPIWEDDVITETFCRCNDGTYGLTCLENFLNPCVNRRQYASADNSIAPNYFIECTANIPYLMKCAPGTKWNEKIVTCDWDYNTKRYENHKKGNPVEVSKKQLIGNYDDRNKEYGYHNKKQKTQKEGNLQETYRTRKDEWEPKKTGYNIQEVKDVNEYNSEKLKPGSEQYLSPKQKNDYKEKIEKSEKKFFENLDEKNSQSGYQSQPVYGNQESGGLSGYEIPKGQLYGTQGGQAAGMVSGNGGKINGVASGAALNFDGQKGSMNDAGSGYQSQPVYGNQESGGLSGYEIPKGQTYGAQVGQAAGMVSGNGGKINGVASGAALNFDGKKGSMNNAGSGYQSQPVYGNQESGGLSGYEIPKGQLYGTQGGQAAGMVSGNGGKINGVASGAALNFDGQKGSMNDAGSGYQSQPVYGNQESGGLSGYEIPKGQLYGTQVGQAAGMVSGNGGKINGVASGAALNFDGQKGSMNDAGSGYQSQPVYGNQESGGLSGYEIPKGQTYGAQVGQAAGMVSGNGGKINGVASGAALNFDGQKGSMNDAGSGYQSQPVYGNQESGGLSGYEIPKGQTYGAQVGQAAGMVSGNGGKINGVASGAALNFDGQKGSMNDAGSGYQSQPVYGNQESGGLSGYEIPKGQLYGTQGGQAAGMVSGNGGKINGVASGAALNFDGQKGSMNDAGSGYQSQPVYGNQESGGLSGYEIPKGQTYGAQVGQAAGMVSGNGGKINGVASGAALNFDGQKGSMNDAGSGYQSQPVYGNQESGGLSGYEIPKGQTYGAQVGQAAGMVSGNGGKINGVASGAALNFDGQKGSMNDAGSGYQSQPVYGNQESGGLSGYEIPKGQLYGTQGGQAAGMVSGNGGKINGVASGAALNFDGQKGSMNDAGSGYQSQPVYGNQESGGLSGYEIPKGQLYGTQGGQAAGMVSGNGGKINGVASGAALNFDGQKGSMNDAGSGYQSQPVYGNQESGGLSGYEIPKGQTYGAQVGQAAGMVSGNGGKINGVASGAALNFDGQKGSMNDAGSGYQSQPVYGNQESGGLSGYEIPKGQLYGTQGGQAAGMVSGNGGKINGVASGAALNFDGQKGSMNDAGSGYQSQPVYGNQESGGLSGYEKPKGQTYGAQVGQAAGMVSGNGGKINGVASGAALNFDGQKGSMNDAGSGYQSQPVYGNQESGGLSGYEIPKGQLYGTQGGQAAGMVSGNGGKINGVDSSKGSLFVIQKPTEHVNDHSKLSPELKRKIEEIKYSYLNGMGSSKFSSKDLFSVYDSSSFPNDYASSFKSSISNENSVFDDFKNTLSNSNPSVSGFDSSIQNIYEAFLRNKIENFQGLNKSQGQVHSSNYENPIEYIKNVISNAKNKPFFDSYQMTKIPSITPGLGNQEIIFGSDYSKLNQVPITKPNYQSNYGQDQEYKSEKYSIQEQSKFQYKPVETNYPKSGENLTDFFSQENVAFKNNEPNDIMNDESGYQTPQVHEKNGAFENEASNDVSYDGQKESVESSPVQGYQPILSDKNANYQLNVDSSKLSVQETDKLLKFLLPKITSTQMGHQQFFKIDIPIDKNSQAYCKDSPNGVTIGLSLSFF